MADENDCKVYVGSLNFSTTDEGLEDHFKNCGTVTDARVIVERDTGRSRGFGFVTFQDFNQFEKALTLNGSELDGRKITVSKANARTGGGGGGRGGAGGYNRGGRRDYGAGRQYGVGGRGYQGGSYQGGSYQGGSYQGGSYQGSSYY